MVGAWEPPPSLPHVVLYSRTDCHLCDKAKALLSELCKESPFTVIEKDVDCEEPARMAYSDRIPVILVNGYDVRGYPPDEKAVRRALKAAAERT